MYRLHKFVIHIQVEKGLILFNGKHELRLYIEKYLFFIYVQSLIAEPFSSRSLTDKAEIKRLGRPTPNLNIIQSVSSKKRSFNRTFNRAIYNKHTWICGCEIKNALFCFPCLLFGGESSWTKTGFTDLNHSGDRIKKHTLSEKHDYC
ncbi:hypothetical protein RN001_001518 [Aquatica leii]|uniref:Uncharacterized protein n=1 Tax=Aquatica leii TaxID=1421715 RepID=A0AAN7Q7X1_9COLE|nr:hypothetical protein RN001_001518 [Aquatica leii]